jgi:hypothetical protein
MRLTNRIFSGSSAREQLTGDKAPQEGHDLASIKTYRYLRLGMLAGVAALFYSILEERFASGVNCWLGAISDYYYTPVHPVFVGVMVAIGLALIVIKGSTVVEDAFLSLAGVMAPVVAFVPTMSVSDRCSNEMAAAGHYLPPAVDPRVANNSISNDLHAYVFAGSVILGLLLVVGLVQWLRNRNKHDDPSELDQYTAGTWWSLVGALAVAGLAWGLLEGEYSWVLKAHGYSALAMFAFLALAALANGVFGVWKKYKYTKIGYAVVYLIIAAAMVATGIVYEVVDQSAFNGHLVLVVEIIELGLFATFWALQTVERWDYTV